jgi:hypothetical protein
VRDHVVQFPCDARALLCGGALGCRRAFAFRCLDALGQLARLLGARPERGAEEPGEGEDQRCPEKV